jgi:hypothetical protein
MNQKIKHEELELPPLPTREDLGCEGIAPSISGEAMKKSS